MAEDLDHVSRYARELGFAVRPRTILVEGTNDVALFERASRYEKTATGIDLLGADLAIIAGGVGDLGGTRGVLRELMCMRGLARTYLLPDGRPKYRFVALFDNDKAGQMAVRSAGEFDSSILEYKDMFRLQPVMPRPVHLDPNSIKRAFEKENVLYKGLKWEVEDLLPKEFIEAFVVEYPLSLIKSEVMDGRTHREFTINGKSQLHHYIKQNAIGADLLGVVEVLKCMRHYLGIK